MITPRRIPAALLVSLALSFAAASALVQAGNGYRQAPPPPPYYRSMPPRPYTGADLAGPYGARPGYGYGPGPRYGYAPRYAGPGRYAPWGRGSGFRGPWNNRGNWGKFRNPFAHRGAGSWFNPDKENMARNWDDMLNAPSRMGRMPGGWEAPSVSMPNPIDVGDEFSDAARDLPQQMDNFRYNN